MKQIMRRAAPLALLVAAYGIGCSGSDAAESAEAEELGSTSEALAGGVLKGLTEEQRARFSEGADAFAEVEGVADGLGPVFNERGCGNCHSVGGLGGSGVQFEVHAGRLSHGQFDPLQEQGGQLFDLFSVTSLPPEERSAIPGCLLPPNGEPIPAQANVTARRRTTALFGLGLVDATPDATFLRLAAHQPRSIRGRAPLVDNISAGQKTVGKFGWKDQNPTLFQFAGDAYLNEMGITNPEFPDEQAPSGDPSAIAACDGKSELEDDGEDVELFTDFMSLLAPPMPAHRSHDAKRGDALFDQIGCNGCHVRTLKSGRSDVAALSRKSYHPFSDFLLHDMGSLGDNVEQADAGLREMRTAPLWGLRFVDPDHLLHDGRADSVEDAVLKHDGQGRAARDRFARLSKADQRRLLAFLATL